MADGSFALKLKAFTEMDMRLLKLKKEAQYSKFRIPRNDKGGYFTLNANFEPFEQVYCIFLLLIFSLMIYFAFLYQKSLLVVIITHVQVIIPYMLRLFLEAVIDTIVLFKNGIEVPYVVACIQK
jgi:hypothetical protein